MRTHTSTAQEEEQGASDARISCVYAYTHTRRASQRATVQFVVACHSAVRGMPEFMPQCTWCQRQYAPAV